jgi:hypothetical protein
LFLSVLPFNQEFQGGPSRHIPNLDLLLDHHRGIKPQDVVTFYRDVWVAHAIHRAFRMVMKNVHHPEDLVAHQMQVWDMAFICSVHILTTCRGFAGLV